MRRVQSKDSKGFDPEADGKMTRQSILILAALQYRHRRRHLHSELRLEPTIPRREVLLEHRLGLLACVVLLAGHRLELRDPARHCGEPELLHLEHCRVRATLAREQVRAVEAVAEADGVVRRVWVVVVV
jgi:hypothetical protein